MPPDFSTADPAARLAGLKQLHPLLVGCGDTGPPQPSASGAALSTLARPGVLMDCLGAAGSGAGVIALWLCRQVCQDHGELVVVDPTGEFYPPAAIAWGVDPRRLLVVSPQTDNEALAAIEQTLRSPAARAVWAPLERVPQQAFRRLLLATEAGNAFAALVRSSHRAGDPCCADYQFCFSPEPLPDADHRTLRVRAAQTRNRHGKPDAERVIAVDWRAGVIRG